jgi:AcrR family transcriptional regulator
MRELTDNIADALPKAAAVFAERGLDGTRMDDIVEATGVPRPTLYYHFSSKEEILAWLLQRLLRDLSIEIGGIVDRDEPARDRLRSIIAAYLQLFADHTQLCTVLLTELGRITRIPALADAIWAAFHEPLGKVLDAGERDGSMRASDHEMTAWTERVRVGAGILVLPLFPPVLVGGSGCGGTS